MALGQLFRLEQIEQITFKLLCEYGQLRTQPDITLPIPVERIAEDLLDLALLWEPIKEADGQTILAKLVPHHRLVIFNETHQALFDDTPFLYNTTLAHEIGHWELHMERGKWVRRPTLFEMEEIEFPIYRSNGSNSGSWDEKNAHRFMGCLLMPQHLLTAAVANNPITDFSGLYRLRDQFEVTITALTIRLQDLNLAYIDADGRFYPSREAFNGQTALW